MGEGMKNSLSFSLLSRFILDNLTFLFSERQKGDSKMFNIHESTTNDIVASNISSNNGLNALKQFLRENWGETTEEYTFKKNKDGLWTAKRLGRMGFVCRPTEIKGENMTKDVHAQLLPEIKAADYIRVISDVDDPFGNMITTGRKEYRVCAVKGDTFKDLWKGSYKNCVAVALGF
jgi:hypothetical protein